MGGHSARAMQLAVKYYKDMGGTYSGKKSSDNKLSKWSKEDWQTREELFIRSSNYAEGKALLTEQDFEELLAIPNSLSQCS